MPYFVENIEEIRERARRRIDEGPVTEGYHLDKDRAISILNEALATEIVCVLRYMHHYFMATGVHGRAVANEFKEHADDEREHADRIGERIQQLGGKTDLNPGTLVGRSVSQYVEGETLADMIREDLVAERIVIDVYREMIRFFGIEDPTSRVMLEEIMAEEEEHANDLADLLYVVNPESGETEGVDRGAVAETVTGAKFQTDAPQAQQPRRQSGGSGTQSSQRRPEEVASLRFASNREATTRQAGSGTAASGDSGANAQGSRAEARPARATEEERPDIRSQRGQEVPPAHSPGSTGRPTRKQTPTVDAVAGSEEEGGQAGESRAVRITNPNRKGKKIA
jgi:bacterioferritin